MRTRITTFVTEEEGISSVSDIIELTDGEDLKATRRRIMTRLGFIVDQMLDGSYGFDRMTVERE